MAMTYLALAGTGGASGTQARSYAYPLLPPPKHFRPMIPSTMSVMQAMRDAERGSPNIAMPKMATPTAPIPVQTAYPVPTGMVLSACANSAKLPTIATSVPTLGQNLVKPAVNFKPTAQAISSNPATINVSQFILAPP